MNRLRSARPTVVLGVGIAAGALIMGISTVSSNSASPSARPLPAAVGKAAPPAAAPVRTLAFNAPPHPTQVYQAVTPCRIANTATKGGRIAHGRTRSFKATGDGSLAGQGGSKTGCKIPAYAKSVAVSVTVSGETRGGHLTLYASGTTAPTARAVTFAKNVSQTGNLTVALGANGRVVAYNVSKGSLHITLDVTGYYQEPIEGLIYTGSSPTSGSVYSGSTHIVSVNWLATGIADIVLDQDVTYCTPVAGAYYGSNTYANAKAFNDKTVRVYTWYLNASNVAVYNNAYVYLTVTC